MYGALRRLLDCWIKALSVFILVLCFAETAATNGQTPIPSLQAQSPKKQTASSDKPAQEPQHDTKQTPPIIKESPTSESDQKPKHFPEQHDSHSTPDWWLIGVTGMLVIATAGLVYYARDTGRRQLRAYVSATPNNLIYNIGPPPNIRYRFSIINHGQTPAYHVTDTALVDIFPYPLPPNFNFPDFPSPHPSRIVLHPDARTYSGEAHATRSFAAQEIGQIVTGNQCRLYIFGVVRYVDIFKEPHTTKFCHSVVGSPALFTFLQGGPSAQGLHLDSESADQHDDTD